MAGKPLGVAMAVGLAMIMTTACAPKTDANYLKSIDDWHQKRVERLKAPDSWLSLAGLYWLTEGENSFGAGPSNDVVFPPEKGPAEMGVFILENGRVTVKVKKGVGIYHDGAPVTTLEMKSDASGDPTVLSHGSLSWLVIQRGEQIGIRLRDSANPRIAGFKGIERFPVSEKWRIEAEFKPYDRVKILSVPTVLGTIDKSPCSGALVFEIDGREYRLDPIADEGSPGFFIIFGDATNGKETYGAGRFLGAEAAGPDGKVILDFNKAYNPPCAFSPFATCPLPPKQNVLPVAIKAGEKAYAGGHH